MPLYLSPLAQADVILCIPYVCIKALSVDPSTTFADPKIMIDFHNNTRPNAAASNCAAIMTEQI